MLVLSRLKGQTVMIGDDIEITVVDVRGDKVRIGVAAPRDITVHRKEIYDAIRAENRSAAEVRPAEVGGVVAAPTPTEPGLKLVRPVAPDPLLGGAIDEARASLAEGGVPTGSILVRDGRIIGRGRNQCVQRGDPMAHAEIEALRNAGPQTTYADCVLYSTLIPCYLCSGAIVQLGIPRVIIGDTVHSRGAPDLLRVHRVQVSDLHDSECIALMSTFIQEHPELWNEGIGRQPAR